MNTHVYLVENRSNWNIVKEKWNNFVDVNQTFITREGGSGVRDMAPPKEELTLGSLKRHSLILRPLLRKSAVVIFRQQFKMFDPNNFTPSSMFFFQNAWPIKETSEYTLILFHTFIHFLDRIGSQLAYFLKLLN